VRAKYSRMPFLLSIWIMGMKRPATTVSTVVFIQSVMIDASHEDFENNVAITRRVVDAAHRQRDRGRGGIRSSWVAWKSMSALDEADAKLTDPERAKEFVERSGMRFTGCCDRYLSWRIQIQRCSGLTI
jgi:hypothetical protein